MSDDNARAEVLGDGRLAHETSSDQAAYFVRAAARTLAVIRCFGADAAELTLTQVAARAGLDRATARRLLLTLRDLGYVAYDGRLFSLTAHTLQLGYSYLSGMTLAQTAQPYLQEIAERLGETSSLTVLDGDEVLYLAVATSSGLASVRVTVGTRFAAHATSMGRVLLAGLSDAALDVYLDRLAHRERHERRARSISDLRDEIVATRERGWATVSEELEAGLRGVAAPVTDAAGRVIAAVNVSAHSSHSGDVDLREVYVPEIRRTVGRIQDGLAGRRLIT